MRFSITGEFLTEKSRDLVLSGTWREALEFLVDSLEGMTHDMAVSILKGDKKLIGKNETLDITDEDPEVKQDYQSECHSVYRAGRLVYDGKRYKAYGYVQNATPDDSERARNNILHRTAKYPEWNREISVPYMYDRKNDLAFLVKLPHNQMVVSALFERDTDDIDLPLWMTGGFTTSPQEAIDEYPISNVGPALSSPYYTTHRVATGKVHPDTQTEYQQTQEELARGGLVDHPAPWADEPRDPLKPDVIDSLNQYAQESYAQQFGMTIEEYSAHLRDKVLTALKERGYDEWESFTYTLDDQPSKTIKYPVELAKAYAFGRTNADHLAPEWKAVSPSGSKMECDNPVHTDLWLALGFDLGWTVYSSTHPDHILFHDLTSHIQKKYLNYDVHVLTAGGQTNVYGKIRTPETFDRRQAGEDTILCVPHAGPEFETMALKSKAVICEQGGKLAHLVIVGRELNLPIIRDDNALTKYTNGMRVSIDLKAGKIDVWAEPKLFTMDISGSINP